MAVFALAEWWLFARYQILCLVLVVGRSVIDTKRAFMTCRGTPSL